MTSFLSNPSVSPIVSPSPLSPLQIFRRKASVGSSKFIHNERVILAFLPCLLVLSAYGGRWVIGTIVIGTLATYIADALGSSAG
jgi:hypothetical protein